MHTGKNHYSSQEYSSHESENGAAAVEFALVLPVLLLLVFGIIYFSLYFNALQGTQAAAREGARLASLRTSTSKDACDAATTALTGVPVDNGTAKYGVANSLPVSLGDCSLATYPCQNQNITNNKNVYVKVEAKVTFQIPFWSGGAGIKTVSSTASFRCE